MSVIVRLVIAVTFGVEGKLQHFHAREAGLFQKLMHFGGEEAQVLGDDLPVTDDIPQRLKQFHTGSLYPGPVHSSVFVRGNLIIGLKSAEMVDPDRVIEEKCMLHAGLPPGKLLLFVFVPVIDRIAPKLAGGRKGIRRAARNHRGSACLIQFKQVRMAPCIRAVQRDIDGEISQDPDPFFGGICLDCLPLAEKHILHKAIEADLILQLFAPVFHSVRPAQPDIFLPVHPSRILKTAFQSTVEGIVLQPVLVVRDICLKCVPVPVVGGICPFLIRMQGIGAVFIGMMQEQIPHLIDPAVIYIRRITSKIIQVRLFPGEIPVADQLFQIDKIRIAGKSRE